MLPADYDEFKDYQPLIVELDDGSELDSDDYVDVEQGLDYNIMALDQADFEYEEIQEILNISRFRLAQCLAPHGVHFPEFAQPIKFDRKGLIL